MRMAHLGPFVSIKIPKGIPEAYMPMFPALPCYCSIAALALTRDWLLTIRLLWVADSFMRSAYWGAHAEYAYWSMGQDKKRGFEVGHQHLFHCRRSDNSTHCDVIVTNIPSEGYTGGSNNGDDARLVVRILIAILHGVERGEEQ